MDGGKDFPINHGPTSDQKFISDACRAAKEYMQRDPNQLSFSMLVLAPKFFD